MDSSSDISHNFSRSFAEYDSSGLEDDHTEQFHDKIEHPLTKTINSVMSYKATSNSTLKSCQNIVKIINELHRKMTFDLFNYIKHFCLHI